MPELFGFDAFSPKEIAERVETVAVAKARLPLLMLAGAVVGLESRRPRRRLRARMRAACLKSGGTNLHFQGVGIVVGDSVFRRAVMKTRIMFAALAGLMCAVSLAHAQPENAGGGKDALPRASTANGITYVCGGVGSDEAERMKRAARDYDLMLTFATKTGSYVSDVQVDVADARGHSLLNTTCNGPIMLVDLPKAGRYHIRGESEGRAASGDVLLRPGTKGTALHLVLPDSESGSG
jgi:hypothetical protein